MGEDVPTLQRTTDQFVWVKGKISNGNTFIVAAMVLQNMWGITLSTLALYISIVHQLILKMTCCNVTLTSSLKQKFQLKINIRGTFLYNVRCFILVIFFGT